MKKVILMLCACAALICSCSKIGDNISDLNKRVEEYEAESVTLLTKLEALQKIADAKAKQLTIVSIKDTEAGQEIVFSDGKKYVIKDGKDTIVVTEDETSYTFDFGDGKKISVDKTFAFNIADEIEIPVGSELAVPYTVTADDGSVHVTAKSLGKSQVEGIDEEAKEITFKAFGRAGDEQFVNVRAIRNSDGKVFEKVVTLKLGPRAPIALNEIYSGYYGEYYAEGVHNYYTQGYAGEVDDEGYLLADTYLVTVDLYAPMSDVIAIPAGTYVADDTFAAFTYEVGVDIPLLVKLMDEWEEDGWIYQWFLGIYTFEEFIEYLGYTEDELDVMSYYSGASLQYKYPDGKTTDEFAITEGDVKFEMANETDYKVTMNLVADQQDWIFTFEGPIEFFDNDPTNVYYTECIATERYDLYGNGTDVWDLVFSKKSDGTSDEIYMQIVTEGNDIAYGTYTVSDSFDAFTVVNNDICGSSYWSHNGMKWDSAHEGTLTISNPTSSLSGWIMKGRFEDTYYEESWQFLFKGELGIEISDDNWMAPKTGNGKTDSTILEKKPSREGLKEKTEERRAHRAGRPYKFPFFSAR